MSTWGIIRNIGVRTYLSKEKDHQLEVNNIG